MTLVPLVVWAFWIGLYPKPFFKVLDKPVTAIVERVNPDFYRPAAASITMTLPTQASPATLAEPGAAGKPASTAAARPGGVAH
jgi:NADH-quinone oxidoreductase subunit M